MTVSAALVPIFFAMAVGYGAGKTGRVDNRHVDALNTVVMVIALPIALFTILAGADRDEIVQTPLSRAPCFSSCLSPTSASTTASASATTGLGLHRQCRR